MGMEAGVGSHFLGRALREQGHEVRLIPAQFVRPFVKSNKNDYCDAEAIAEAVERENMRFVPIKTEDQLDLQALQHILGPFGVDCDLRRWGLKLAERGGRNGKKRAIVATARKLAVLLHHLWVSGEVYEPLHNSSRTTVAAAA